MKKVSIKFCSVDEARERAKINNICMFNDSIYGIDEEIYEAFNDRPIKVIDSTSKSIAIAFDDGKDGEFVWYVPKVFLDITE